MAIRTYKITLDSKNAIAPEPVLLRQGDKTGAVVIDATLLDNGSPVSLSGLTPMFKANTADGQAVIADSTGFNIVNASGGEFIYQVPSQLGSVDGKIKIAYFSFSDSSGTQSTFNVVFVVERAADMTQESAKDWVSNLNDIISKYNQWVNDAHSSWQDFVSANKQIIESIDPGGTLLNEIIDARRPAHAAEAYKTIGERMNAADTERVKFNKQLLSLARRNYRNNLSYKTISSTLYTDGTINDDKLTRVYNTGADLALVVMATINNSADPHPVPQDDSRVLDVINRAKAIGLKTTMLKPHIGLVNQYDSFYRGNYDPSDYAAFFENWQTILLNYADICDKNAIPILCIGCEQDKCTAPMYISNWAEIIAAIKAKYPNLKLTYAMSATEYLAVDSNGQIAKFVDYVGLNAYPIYLQRLFDQNVTTEELITAWYQDADNRKTMDIIDKYATIYGKLIFITETGVTPYSDGLARLVSINQENLNFDAQAAAYKATFEAIAQNANIIGLSIWNTNAPFNFYNDATTTKSEQVLTDYFKGGKI